MARPLRIEWPGASYHLTDRGNERQAIFGGERGRRHLLKCLEGAVERFGLLVYLAQRYSEEANVAIGREFGGPM